MLTLIDYNQALNQQQLQAVTSINGPHLVIAGAGSGKTRVLVYRTAYLVEQGTDPTNILLLTFTRRAANEMLERASAILDDRCRKVSGGTFHSFANLILRQYATRIELPVNFTILDEADTGFVINRIRQDKGLHKLDKRFPRKDTISAIISKSINKNTDVAAVMYDEYPQFQQWIEEIEQIKQDYAVAKREMGALDFDDLLIALRNLLQTKEDVRTALSQHYRYIMVDEYQDTNRIQAEIIQLLACDHDNVMVVGDDSQSIYSFRGAHFKNIIHFPDVFPGTKVIKLEENYRSSQPILDLTNEIILSAREKFEKILFTRNEGGCRPVYRDMLNENAQSKYIICKIQELLQEGTTLGEIAVLFRSGWHSNDLEIELSSCGIPFVKYGGYKFLESAHVKDAVSYLRLVQNPSDQVSWIRVLTLMRGVGPKTALTIAKEASAGNAVMVTNKHVQKHASVKRLLEFLKTIDPAVQSPTEILDLALQFYYPFLMDQYDDYDKRANDLESLQKIVERYASLNDFLTDLTLDPPEKSRLEAQRHGKDKSSLVLSTIHSAKGLEWDTVFVIHLCEGFMPSYRSFDNTEALEEERRLFYVASTRAKRNLFLLRPQMVSSRALGGNNGTPFTRVSRFLGEGRILDLLVDIESQQMYSGEETWQRSAGGKMKNLAALSDYFDRTESAWDNRHSDDW
jgi:DNA helicase-2/ATP-dependent DNA helicase PcrA